MPSRRIITITVSIITVLGFFCWGVYLGVHSYSLPVELRKILLESGPGLTADEGVELIKRDYFRQLNNAQLGDAALNGAVSGLHDRYSHYFSPQEYKDFLQSSQGEFSGVGVQIAKVSQGLLVKKVFTNSPAEKVGIQNGDIITTVDGKSIAGKSTQAAIKLIKGETGAVRLTLQRQREQLNKVVTRSKVKVPVVNSRLVTQGRDHVAVVRLLTFTDGAHQELRKTIDNRLHQGATAIVLDLRGNGGGLIDEAVQIASIFIKSGTIVTTKGRRQPTHIFKATGNPIASTIPVVVLVDKNSASAAEIVAGALQDHHRAKLVGERTYGKGVFQQIIELSNNGALDLTVGEYFLPSGRNIGDGSKRGSGLKPDIAVQKRSGTKGDASERRALQQLQGVGHP